MLLRVVTSCILPEIARAVAGRAGLAAASTAHASLDLPPRQRLDSSTLWRAEYRKIKRPFPPTCGLGGHKE
jgi:hypothetical protein